ncbi:MAG: ThuA domain-containing protein [Turicibacter sp.]|nr:ThuA domain-containing protein [Turicibacter sp.]
MKKIHAFVGDYYHEAGPISTALQTAAVGVGEDIELLIDDLQTLSEVLSSNPAAIIIAREDRLNPVDAEIHHWLTSEIDKKLEKYVQNGGRLLAIHAGLASYPENSSYVQMLKGYFITHPEAHCPVRYHSHDMDFVVIDEHYFTHVEEAATEVFLRSNSCHGEYAAGWRHPFGRGKVMCLVPTHNMEGYKHQEVIRLYKEAIEYAIS